MEDRQLAIIVINYNNNSDTLACLKSIPQSIGSIPYHIFLIDNASKKPLPYSDIKEWVKPENYLVNKNNLGFSGGVNQGIELAIKAFSSHFLLLNNDIICERNALEVLFEASQNHSEYGIWSPKIMLYKNKHKLWQAGFRLKQWFGTLTPIKLKHKIEEAQMVPGACMLISKSAIDKVGYFNNDFFMYYEDADYCFKAKNSNVGIAVATESIVYHKADNKRHDSNLFVFYYLTRNHILFIKKYLSSTQYCIAFLYHFTYNFARSIYYSLKHKQIAYLKVFILAIQDYKKGKFNRRHSNILETPSQ